MREQENAFLDAEGVTKKGGNVFVNTLNVIMQPLGRFIDPVAKVCYEPIAAHFERKYKEPHGERASFVLLIDMFLLALVGGLAVFALFGKFIFPLFPIPPVVTLTLDGPEAVVSGAPVEFSISYKNTSDRQLGCAHLHIQLPKNTFIDGTLPELERGAKFCSVGSHGPYAVQETKGRTEVIGFSIGEIPAGWEDTVRFNARVYGPTGTSATLGAALVYWEEGRASSSRVNLRREIPITDSVLPVEVVTPPALYRGRQTSVAVRYAYRGEMPAADALVRLTVPGDFVVTGAEPAFSRDHEWALTDLEPETNGILTVNGYFLSRPTAAAPVFTAQSYLHEGDALVLASMDRANADPRASDFAFAHEVTSPAGRDVLHPGETVTVTLRYRNGGKEAVTGFSAALEATSRYVEGASPEGLRWDGASDAALSRIEPGTEGTLVASFKVRETISAADLENDDYPKIRIGATATYFLADDRVQPVRLDAPVAEFSVTTRPAIAATGFYYTKDGDQVGIGPLPPKVGETTKFRVFLHMTNTTGALEGAKVEATLPPGVEWTGRTSVTDGEAIDFLPTSRRVRWTIGRIEPFVGSVGPQVGASFELALTPTDEMVGTEPLLLTDIVLTGTDEPTGYVVRATALPVTTGLPFDSKAKGKGWVRR